MTKAPFVRIPRAWELSEREVTEESLHRNRREIIKSLGLASRCGTGIGIWNGQQTRSGGKT
jgi:hypothetical protein